MIPLLRFWFVFVGLPYFWTLIYVFLHREIFQESERKNARKLFIVSAFLPIFFLCALLFSVYSKAQTVLACFYFDPQKLQSAKYWQPIFEITHIATWIIGVVQIIFLLYVFFRRRSARVYTEMNDHKIYHYSSILLTASVVFSLLVLLATYAISTARVKGINAAIQGDLAGLRVQLSLYYDDHNNTYPIVTGSNAVERWGALMKQIGWPAVNNPCYESTHDPRYQYDYINSPDGQQWRTVGILSTPSIFRGKELWFYCVDSAGFGGKISRRPAEGEYQCPSE